MTPVTYTLNADDMLAGNRLSIRRYVRKGLPKFSLFLLVVAAAITLFVAIDYPQPINVVAGLFAQFVALYIGVAGVMIAFLLFVMPRQRAKKNMAQMPALSRPQTVEWNETSIAFTSEYGNAVIPLADLHQWAANDAMLILYPADHVFYLIPKHYVDDAAAWESLIAAIRQAGIKRI